MREGEIDRWCKGDGGVREVALLGGMFRISNGVMVLVVALCISFDVFFLKFLSTTHVPTSKTYIVLLSRFPAFCSRMRGRARERGV